MNCKSVRIFRAIIIKKNSTIFHLAISLICLVIHSSIEKCLPFDCRSLLTDLIETMLLLYIRNDSTNALQICNAVLFHQRLKFRHLDVVQQQMVQNIFYVQYKILVRLYQLKSVISFTIGHNNIIGMECCQNFPLLSLCFPYFEKAILN